MTDQNLGRTSGRLRLDPDQHEVSTMVERFRTAFWGDPRADGLTQSQRVEHALAFALQPGTEDECVDCDSINGWVNGLCRCKGTGIVSDSAAESECAGDA